MKKAIQALLMIFIFSSVTSASGEIIIKSALSNVKVFSRGAQLNYSARTKIEKGINEIVLSGLASNIDRNSINISGNGDAVIMSVVQRFDYLRSAGSSPQIKILRDSLQALDINHKQKQNEADALNAVMEMILANKNIGNEKIGVSPLELQKMADFYRKKIFEVKNEILQLSIDMKNIEKKIESLNKQLNELNAQASKPVNELVLTVSGKNAGTFEINFSYLIYDAGWQPIYDVRVEKLNSPAQLSYKANVWQNCGIDWNDVDVILSTRNPNVNNSKPELDPWFIDFARPVVYREMMKSSPARLSVAGNAQFVQDAKPEAPAETMADYMNVIETQLSVEFSPAIKYSIPSDSKPHSVSLQEFSVPAKYEYYAVPKLDNNGFLTARLTDWTSYNLLPGQANIYFENSYIGQSFIDPATTKDTLTLSLGRDNNISVSRDVLKDFSEDKFLSSNVERTFAYEIRIRNNKRTPVNIIVEDQIPISKNEDITVKMIDSSGAVFNAWTGQLKWNVEIEAGKSVTRKLVYSVKYPKDKPVQGM